MLLDGVEQIGGSAAALAVAADFIVFFQIWAWRLKTVPHDSGGL
jgi:hypothetical protein